MNETYNIWHFLVYEIYCIYFGFSENILNDSINGIIMLNFPKQI